MSHQNGERDLSSIPNLLCKQIRVIMITTDTKTLAQVRAMAGKSHFQLQKNESVILEDYE